MLDLHKVTKKAEPFLRAASSEELKEYEDWKWLTVHDGCSNSNVVVDTELKLDSVNPVQNKVITKKFNDVDDKISISNDEISSLKNTLSSLSDSSIVHSEVPTISETLTQFLNASEYIQVEGDAEIKLSDGTTAYLAYITTMENNLKELYYPNTDSDTVGYGWRYTCTSVEAGDWTLKNECERKIRVFNNGTELKDLVVSAKVALETFNDFMSSGSNGTPLDAKYNNSVYSMYMDQTDMGKNGTYWVTYIVSSNPILSRSDTYTISFEKYQVNMKTAKISQFSSIDMLDLVRHFTTESGTECSVIAGTINGKLKDFHDYFGVKDISNGFGSIFTFDGDDDNGMPVNPCLTNGRGKLNVVCPFDFDLVKINSSDEFMSMVMNVATYVGATDYSESMNSELVNKAFYGYLVDTSNETTDWIFFICLDNTHLQLDDLELSTEVPLETTNSVLERLSTELSQKQPKLTAGKNITISDNVISTSGVNNYSDLTNKPSINCVELRGNKTLSELGIASLEDLDNKQNKLTAGTGITIENDIISSTGETNDYEDLTNKPSINNVELIGNKSGTDYDLASNTQTAHIDLGGNTPYEETKTMPEWIDMLYYQDYVLISETAKLETDITDLKSLKQDKNITIDETTASVEQCITDLSNDKQDKNITLFGENMTVEEAFISAGTEIANNAEAVQRKAPLKKWQSIYTEFTSAEKTYLEFSQPDLICENYVMFLTFPALSVLPSEFQFYFLGADGSQYTTYSNLIISPSNFSTTQSTTFQIRLDKCVSWLNDVKMSHYGTTNQANTSAAGIINSSINRSDISNDIYGFRIRLKDVGIPVGTYIQIRGLI